MMVSAAFLDVTRGAEEAFGRCSAFESTPPESTCPRAGRRCCRRSASRVTSREDDHVALVLDEAFRFLDDHLGNLHVARRGLVLTSRR